MKITSNEIFLPILLFYVCISTIIFGYIGYNYLKEEVYSNGYQAAILDIANKSLSDIGCKEGVVLSIGKGQYTYVKNLQCPEDVPEVIDFKPDNEAEFILPHLLDAE